jgi:hypothetical protein
VGIGEARDLGEIMSAGHSLRRQNYSFVTITPPTTARTERTASAAMHHMRIVIAVVLAVVLDVATFATVTTLLTGK